MKARAIHCFDSLPSVLMLSIAPLLLGITAVAPKARAQGSALEESFLRDEQAEAERDEQIARHMRTGAAEH